MGTAIRNLHVPLSTDVYEALRREAARLRRPATQVARDAILQLLEARRREEIARALSEFARKAAGTSDDLDPVLERVGIDCFLEAERRDRKRRR